MLLFLQSKEKGKNKEPPGGQFCISYKERVKRAEEKSLVRIHKTPNIDCSHQLSR
jgi:hypothetical protein